ncbi:hypothetical protein ACIQWN_23640 [Streptomyces vinaceus]|uniref:hypothetical protein n=1 Tax=Streptomyces vinaceus TaxID=1960 RepID=UPI003819164E
MIGTSNVTEQAETNAPLGRALVLGPGGLAGTAWMAGQAQGLRHHGVDLSEADVTAATSTGAIVAAALCGQNGLGRLALPLTGASPRPAVPQAGRAAEVFAVLGTPDLTTDEVRRRVGLIAMEAADPRAVGAARPSSRSDRDRRLAGGSPFDHGRGRRQW